MTYEWEARWIRRRFKIVGGAEIETCYDISTGLILCPLCVNIDRVCPSYSEPSLTNAKGMYFFSIEDLYRHMVTHTKMSDEGKRLESVEVEEEELEEEEEELDAEGF